ncbi:ABC transporter permease [Streptomyces sp. VRA16 Mangrove soil]|uniref:ABC transporter permease n=1 Tax=Streptomyces sp. VRA16 Mangrove soil TaxID=2817434 RepID=UPI001A9DD348|nr:ABC transporter permease [Streptomyces sp. VRA16 Mangrove soil]MBO1331186.1 ABC transporter permease [Streptomyces sp. VRA16 Mangrove soil]
MTGFLLRRVAGAVFVLFALSVVVYAAFYVAPGDVAQIACGPRCSPAQVAQVSDQLHLGDPLYLQYAHFVQALFAGRDYSTGTGVLHCPAPCLGLSYQSDQQVTQLILGKLPATASLVVGGAVLWVLLGVGTGILSVWRRGRPTERILTWITLAGMATPVFVIGLLLIIVLVTALQILPFPDYVPFTENPEQWAWNLLLPWVSLALVSAAPYARMTRAAMLETLAEDHVRTFRAYGVGERTLVRRHALRGALAPVIALGALDIGSMFGGAVLTESLFGIPGICRELVDAVKTVDLPVVVGLVLVTGFFVVLANAVADVLQALADRRVVLA